MTWGCQTLALQNLPVPKALVPHPRHRLRESRRTRRPSRNASDGKNADRFAAFILFENTEQGKRRKRSGEIWLSQDLNARASFESPDQVRCLPLCPRCRDRGISQSASHAYRKTRIQLNSVPSVVRVSGALANALCPPLADRATPPAHPRHRLASSRRAVRHEPNAYNPELYRESSSSLVSGTCKPHSALLPLKRPARSSSPSPTGRVLCQSPTLA